MRILLGVILSATAALGAPIRLGHVNSMTGSEASYGSFADNAIRMAIEETNRRGGVHGRPVELVTVDDQGKSEEAVTAVTQLLTRNGVLALFGETTSGRTLAIAPIAQSAKVPLVTATATNPKVTAAGDYVFRVCFIDPFQGPVAARFAMERLRLKRFAILTDARSDYSIGLATEFIKAVKVRGGVIAGEVKHGSGDVEFRPQLTAIREMRPDAVFIPGFYSDVGLIARQAREMHVRVPLLGGDAWDSPKLFELAGPLSNAYFSSHFSWQDRRPEVVRFVAEYKKRYGTEPNSVAALNYDSAKLVLAAIGRAKELTPSAVRDAIQATRAFRGVTGTIDFDAHRDAVKSATILKVGDGKFSFMSTVEPDRSSGQLRDARK